VLSVLSASTDKAMDHWYGPWQPMNQETMFVLQLHPIYRGMMSILSFILGFSLFIEGRRNLDRDCGEVKPLYLCALLI